MLVCLTIIGSLLGSATALFAIASGWSLLVAIILYAIIGGAIIWFGKYMIARNQTKYAI